MPTNDAGRLNKEGDRLPGVNIYAININKPKSGSEKKLSTTATAIATAIPRTTTTTTILTTTSRTIERTASEIKQQKLTHAVETPTTTIANLNNIPTITTINVSKTTTKATQTPSEKTIVKRVDCTDRSLSSSPLLIVSVLYPRIIEKVHNDFNSTTNPRTTKEATEISTLTPPGSPEPEVLTATDEIPKTEIAYTVKEKRAPTQSKRKRRRRALKLRNKRKSAQNAIPSEKEVQEKKSLTLCPPTSVVPAEYDYSTRHGRPKKYIFNHLDVEFLNKIETLECEVKSPVTKRRRGNNVQTRKRSAASATPNKAQVGNFAENTDPLSIPTVNPEKKQPNISGVSGSKKRNRVMSLYERRYQNDDARGIVANGYITSTRNTTVSSNAVLSEADTPEMTNQYYMAGSSTVGAAVTPGSASAVNHAPSMATLCNIGNTCYLNSVVYTLRFAPQFLHNLHHLIVDLNTIQQSIVRQRTKSFSLGRGLSGVHIENSRSWSSKDLASMEQYNTAPAGNATTQILQKSSHQMLTERLHDLYQNLHRNEVTESTEPFHADTLLHAVQDVNAIFEGNQQQDAHEFLMCLLNSIRETCQTLIKAIVEYPDVISNGSIPNADEVDTGYALEKDAAAVSSHASTGGGNSSSSSLSTSNITKASFFSRKSKRKEETKNSKNIRLQSPLKDGGGNAMLQQQLQPTSNSLFYLNTVDLSAASLHPSANTSTASSTATTGKAKSVHKGSDGDEGAPVNLLKDKERLAEKIRELGLDFFREDFEGVTVSTTKCLSCETITEQKESMIDIAVPVPISGYESSDYTDKSGSFIQNSCITREYFRGENKYRCEKCTGYTEAIRSISYEVLPRLLVIQLSRFSGGMEKINSYIPTAFTLQCFCSKCCALNDANKLHVYKLYSVITHVGATMSVGHYIAYTCSLDWANEYVNCPKDRRTSQQQPNPTANGGLQNSSISLAFGAAPTPGGSEQRTQFPQSSAASAAASVLASSGTSLMKKMKFGRSKASSSGDMSKNMKNLNGITSKAIINGIGKLSMNTSCHSLNCCATLCSAQQHQQLANCNDLTDESVQNGSNQNVSFNNFSLGYGSTGRNGSKHSYASSAAYSGSAEPIWYMCDDDKIKAMTQTEFEELLSPARKITVPPYLLFYARFDLQPTQTSTPSKQSPPQSSWSNDSLQSGQHRI